MERGWGGEERGRERGKRRGTGRGKGRGQGGGEGFCVFGTRLFLACQLFLTVCVNWFAFGWWFWTLGHPGDLHGVDPGDGELLQPAHGFQGLAESGDANHLVNLLKAHPKDPLVFVSVGLYGSCPKHEHSP